MQCADAASTTDDSCAVAASRFFTLVKLGDTTAYDFNTYLLKMSSTVGFGKIEQGSYRWISLVDDLAGTEHPRDNFLGMGADTVRRGKKTPLIPPLLSFLLNCRHM